MKLKHQMLAFVIMIVLTGCNKAEQTSVESKAGTPVAPTSTKNTAATTNVSVDAASTNGPTGTANTNKEEMEKQ